MIIELNIDDDDIRVIELVGERIFGVEGAEASAMQILYSWLNGLADVATKYMDEKEDSSEVGYSGEGSSEADGGDCAEGGSADDEALEEVPGDIAG